VLRDGRERHGLARKLILNAGGMRRFRVRHGFDVANFVLAG